MYSWTDCMYQCFVLFLDNKNVFFDLRLNKRLRNNRDAGDFLVPNSGATSLQNSRNYPVDSVTSNYLTIYVYIYICACALLKYCDHHLCVVIMLLMHGCACLWVSGFREWVINTFTFKSLYTSFVLKKYIFHIYTEVCIVATAGSVRCTKGALTHWLLGGLNEILDKQFSS